MRDAFGYGRHHPGNPSSGGSIAKTNTRVMLSSKEQAAQRWFGYGRWEAPYWFIGMEQGGNDDHSSYEAWLRLGGTELIDCRAHHLHPEFPGLARWHTGDRPATQSTWRRLIQLLLAYNGRRTDLEAVRRYQRDEWGSLEGETAVVEVSALHSPNLSGMVDRTAHREQRISALHSRIVEYQPDFAVMYGLGYRDLYARIAGSMFDGSGFARSGKTLCVLVEHPTARPSKPAAWWVEKGHAMRTQLRGV